MIKRFIENNREAFDDAPLPEGHFERFERRLKLVARRRRLLRTIRVTAATAAVTAVIFVAGYALLTRDEKKTERICILSDEMLETRRYYAAMLNTAKVRVERIVATAEPEIRRELNAELSSIVADSASFCNNSDQSAAIMIQYYGSKMVALRNMENALAGASKQ